jgi:DnaJ-class molecular chaperone
MSGTYYERDEDWLITCPECHGNGTIGTGVSRIKCPKCGGSGRIKQE